jgi:hypothetical protein
MRYLFILLCLSANAAELPLSGLPKVSALAPADFFVIGVTNPSAATFTSKRIDAETASSAMSISPRKNTLLGVARQGGTPQAQSFTSPNTNLIYVAAAGTTAANGVYTNAGAIYGGSGFKYAQLGGACALFYDPALHYSDSCWNLTNSTGLLYGLDPLVRRPLFGWHSIVGSDPAPQLTYATNYYSEAILSFIVYTNLPAHDLPRTCFVESWGNDDTAAVGRPDRPWASPLTAWSAAPSGGQVLVGAGEFHELNDEFGPLRTARSGVVLRGAGPALTRLTSLSTLGTLWLNTSNLIADLSTDFKIMVGPAYITTGQTSHLLDDVATNAALCNVVLSNTLGDAVYLFRWKDFSLTARQIASGGDVLMVSVEYGSTETTANAVSTNSVLAAFGCSFGPPRRLPQTGVVRAAGFSTHIFSRCFFNAVYEDQTQGRGSSHVINCSGPAEQ